MLAQEVREALQVVEDYKKFNQNTIKKVAKRCPVSKAIFYETVKIDENAVKFVEKYKKEAKKKKQEKHLGKQLMSAPKVTYTDKVKPPKEKKERVYVPRDIPEEKLQLMAQAYDMRYLQGMKVYEIAKEFKLNPHTISGYIKTHRERQKLPLISHEALRVLDLIKKNLTIAHVAKELGLSYATAHYHAKKLKEQFPDVVINRDRSDRKPSARTYAIQELVEQGKTPQEIASELNITEKNVLDAIYRWNKRNSTYKRKEIITETFWKVKELHEAGMMTADIARKLNIKWETAKKNIDKIERVKTA